MVTLTFGEAANFFQSSCSILHSHNNVQGFNSLPPRQYLLSSVFFGDSYLSWWGVVSHGGFDLPCLIGNDIEHFCMCSLTTVHLIWRNIYSNSLPI
jgi:hypothetical protein